MLALYIAIWSWASSLHADLNKMFSDASAMYHLNWYGKYRLYFWKSALQMNFLFFLLSPVACLSLMTPDTHHSQYQRRFFVTVYTFIILLCLLSYQQIFIYNMLAAAPVLFVFYAAFFQWLITLFQSKQDTPLPLGRQLILYLFAAAYLVTLLYLGQILDLPLPYPLLFIAPLILAYYISHQSSITPELKSILSSTILVITVFIGLFYPLNQFFSDLPIINNAYQQANIRVANALLQDGSGYIAGTDLIYDRNQTISGLRNLVAPTIAYLKAPSAELRSVMFASLDQDPNATTSSIIQDLSHSSVKFFVDNYRMLELPIDIKNYLNAHYQHFWGSIYLYAPEVQAGERLVFIPFSGRYLIEAKVANAISLNGQIYQAQSVINLKKGYYQSNAKIAYRLKLIPEGVAPLLKTAFANDKWVKIIY
jgi:hypothetical protein